MQQRTDRGVLLAVVFLVLATVLAGAAVVEPLLGAVGIVLSALLVVLLTQGAARTGVFLMMLAFAAAPMYRGIEGLTGGTVPPTDILAVGAVALMLPGLLWRKIRLPLVYVIGLGGVALCGLVIAAVTGDPGINAFYLAQWLFFIGALPVVVAWWRPGTRTIVALLWSYLAGHLVSTVYAVVEGPLSNDRYDGLTHHTNAFGIAGLASIAICLFLLHHHGRDRWRRVLVVAVAAVAAVSIAMSGSRAATLVAVVLVLLVPIVERSAVSGFLFAICGALVVFSIPALVAVSGEGSAITRLAGDATAQSADKTREDALDHGVDLFWESPIIGNGFSEIEQIHNVFLEVAVAIGAIGLFFYLLVMFTLARPLFSAHPLRRLGYLAWAFIGIAPAVPGLWDRTIWVPLSLALIPALRQPDGDAAVGSPTGDEHVLAAR